jgi:endonuclease/exonuclease/phosphatase (EEP) superfamily protein YafD
MKQYAERIPRWVAGAMGCALLALNLLAFIGFVVRDRSVILALLFYLPLFPLGWAALVVDLACRGRSLRRPRFLLAAVGLAAIVCSGITMSGRGPAPPALEGTIAGGEIRLLHWNVWWGGWPHTDATWASIEETILGQRPDVVVLSEAPTTARLDSLQRRLGESWSSARVERGPVKPGYYQLAVMSRWPVRKGPRITIRNGTAVEIDVEHPERIIRMLLVDGVSRVRTLRTPMLQDIAAACRQAQDRGHPFDTVVGDFNTPSQSVAFEALRSVAGGYTVASYASTGWRGTWPMLMPVYDIDHVCVRAGVEVLGCSLFTNLASDHRGQIARLRWVGRRQELSQPTTAARSSHHLGGNRSPTRIWPRRWPSMISSTTSSSPRVTRSPYVAEPPGSATGREQTSTVRDTAPTIQ